MGRGKTLSLWILGVLAVAGLPAAKGLPVQIITDSAKLAPGVCEELRPARELTIYKDPSLFIANLALIAVDPIAGWRKLFAEDPRLTTLDGTVQVRQLAEPREFKTFGGIAALYQRAEPRLMPREKKPAPRIVSVMLCGDGDAYKNTLGFVLERDLEQAREDRFGADGTSLPPSIYPNPVPKLSRAK